VVVGAVVVDVAGVVRCCTDEPSALCWAEGLFAGEPDTADENHTTTTTLTTVTSIAAARRRQ